MINIPVGLCQCGCGRKTDISKKTNKYWGYVKGHPFRFIKGHQGRKTPVDFVVEDRGYISCCWIWQRSTDSNGYGTVHTATGTRTVFKKLWEGIFGVMPKDHRPDHLCRVPACIRPDHIEAVPHMVNVQRGRAARLNPEAVEEIRIAHSLGFSYRQIARQRGLNKGTVSMACRGITWANVPKEAS